MRVCFTAKVSMIKNWKLALLTFGLILLCCYLGNWQLKRAQLKQQLLYDHAKKQEEKAQTNLELQKTLPSRYSKGLLHGRFDTDHTFLLDNKVHEGKVGYEVYTLFFAKGIKAPILVDRGFIPLIDRKKLPKIPKNENNTAEGVFNLPPSYFSYANMTDEKDIRWPLRVQYINLQKISTYLGNEVYPMVLIMQKTEPFFAYNFKIVTMPPERHLGYAVQWFALALTLLILFVAFNRQEQKRHKNN